jgi:hypothetical protein
MPLPNLITPSIERKLSGMSSEVSLSGFLDESNRLSASLASARIEDTLEIDADHTVIGKMPPAQVTPSSHRLSSKDSLFSDNSSNSSESFDMDDLPPSTADKCVVKTAHKLAEERGSYQVEPLLKENPHRFVLFPIQDIEVSRLVNNKLLNKTFRGSFGRIVLCTDLANVQKSRSFVLDC